MKIYKTTNTVNDKVYIGQTIRPIQQRFRRHINDAMNCNLDTHFARAIRKYGPDVFTIEEIDSATSQKELNEKERRWIAEFNSIENGYNETDAEFKCGGNTYKVKSTEEMTEISEKLRASKTGELNPNARHIARINEQTLEINIYGSIIECAKACGINGGKTSITERLSKKRRTMLHGKYSFRYCDE